MKSPKNGSVLFLFVPLYAENMFFFSFSSFAFRDMKEDKYIFYDEASTSNSSSSTTTTTAPRPLRIRLLFKKEEHAMNFQSALLDWRNSLMGVIVDVDRTIHTIPPPQNLERILFTDYDPTHYDDSPVMSLADLKSNHNHSSVSSHGSITSHLSVISITDTLGKYQCIERAELFAVAKPYKLHLVDKAMGGSSDDDNLLAGSWEFHQLFDGLHTTYKYPSIAVSVKRKHPDIVEVPQGGKRRKVELLLECKDSKVSQILGSRLKAGSTKMNDTLWETSVLVNDCDVFEKNIQHKYDRTMEAWRLGKMPKLKRKDSDWTPE